MSQLPCLSHVHSPFLPPPHATVSLPAVFPRSLPNPKTCAARAESVLQPGCEWSVPPVQPSPLPMAAGPAKGERPGAWKPLLTVGAEKTQQCACQLAGNFNLEKVLRRQSSEKTYTNLLASQRIKVGGREYGSSFLFSQRPLGSKSSHHKWAWAAPFAVIYNPLFWRPTQDKSKSF